MKKLSTPLSEEEVRSLKIREVVYLDGEIYTARDRAHQRMLEWEKMPIDLKNSVIFHCGPIVERKNGEWRVVAAGPTTSSRMNPYEPEVIRKFGIRGIIGKGGMGNDTIKAMEKSGCIYLAITGGAAVLSAERIKSVRGVFWEDLGMPEALWVFEVENFGPLIVAIDSRGRSIYEEVEEEIRKNVEKVKRKLRL
ncbi:MAG: FumA C-terminus/TtdB family hydratase beta subunit [Candidatus Syntropharchaeia archaeon]